MIAIVIQHERFGKPYESPPTRGVIGRGPLISSGSKETVSLERPIVQADDDGIHIDFERLSSKGMHIVEAYDSLYLVRRNRKGAVELYELSPPD